MKNKKKVFIISGIALALVIAIVVIAVTASGKGQGTVNPNDDPTEPTVSIGDDVTIEIPSENPSERDKDTLPPRLSPCILFHRPLRPSYNHLSFLKRFQYL